MIIIPSNDPITPNHDEHELKAHPPTQNDLETQQLPGESAPPPSYYPSEQHADAGASSSNTLVQPMFKSKPTNYLYLFNEHSSVKGEYVIDPGMNIPASLLPPLSNPPEDRRSLCVHSNHGSVNADVWLLSAQRSAPCVDSKTSTKRTILDLGSEHGSVTARVQTIQGAAPFLLTITAKAGTVYVALPRSFHGLLLLTTSHGSISLSNTLSQNYTHLSQVDKTRRYFVGDLSMVDDSDWTGNEVRIAAKHGRISVKYIDEVNSTTNRGLLNRLFGW